MRLSRERKRELLIENYIRTITLNIKAVCDGIEYTYDGTNLIIVDMSDELLTSGNLVIDSAYDTLCIFKGLLIYTKNLNLGHIKNIIGSFGEGILESVAGKYIEELPEYCFLCCKTLQKASFPNLKRIGMGCFYKCYSLKYIELPKLSYIHRDAIAYTEIQELSLGDCNFDGSNGIHDNPNLKRLTFKSVKNMRSGHVGVMEVEYLDLGYFYDNVYNYNFNPLHINLLRESNKNKVYEVTHIVNILIQNNLLTGTEYIGNIETDTDIICSFELRNIFFSFRKLKELHFKLPKSYKRLHLEDYYIKLFEEALSANSILGKVILDN